jgi:hypothetical protein
MLSQVRGPRCAKRYLERLQATQTTDDAAAQAQTVKVLRGGFQNWSTVCGAEAPPLSLTRARTSAPWRRRGAYRAKVSNHLRIQAQSNSMLQHCNNVAVVPDIGSGVLLQAPFTTNPSSAALSTANKLRSTASWFN